MASVKCFKPVTADGRGQKEELKDEEVDEEKSARTEKQRKLAKIRGKKEKSLINTKMVSITSNYISLQQQPNRERDRGTPL